MNQGFPGVSNCVKSISVKTDLQENKWFHRTTSDLICGITIKQVEGPQLFLKGPRPSEILFLKPHTNTRNPQEQYKCVASSHLWSIIDWYRHRSGNGSKVPQMSRISIKSTKNSGHTNYIQTSISQHRAIIVLYNTLKTHSVWQLHIG